MQAITAISFIQLDSYLFLKRKPEKTVSIIPKRSESERFFVRSQLRKLDIRVKEPILLKINSQKILREGLYTSFSNS